MWPILLGVLRRYTPYVTLPFAALIGVIGYNIENIVSDRYTPYNDAIKDARGNRLITDESLNAAASIEKLKYEANVLGTNVSPSLQK